MALLLTLEKNTPEGLLVANWAQIHKLTLPLVADTGLSLRLHFREKPQAALLASCTVLLSAGSSLIRGHLR